MLARVLIAALVIDVLVALVGPGSPWIRVGTAVGIQVVVLGGWLAVAVRRENRQ